MCLNVFTASHLLVDAELLASSIVHPALVVVLTHPLVLLADDEPVVALAPERTLRVNAVVVAAAVARSTLVHIHAGVSFHAEAIAAEALERAGQVSGVYKNEISVFKELFSKRK